MFRNEPIVRTDIHRPSVINPADYEFVGFEYLKFDLGMVGLIADERARIKVHMERTGGTYSRHEHGGNCHICGAHCVYTALFYHAATNTYIRTGLDCAEKMEVGDIERFRKGVQNALKHLAGKQKAEALLNLENLEGAWAIYEAVDGGDLHEETIVRDIVAKLVRYGDLTPKQINYLHFLMNKIGHRAEVEAERRRVHDAAADFPVTKDRITIRGVVLTIRVEDTPYGRATKALVLTAAGWKVWGTLPAGVRDLGAEVGDEIEFVAGVEAAKNDPKFGFWHRPKGGRVIAVKAEREAAAPAGVLI